MKGAFSFPIKNKVQAIKFIQQIPNYYKIPTPLPKTYVDINYTDLEDLRTKVSKVNLTIPIVNKKELMLAVKALREFYFFYRLPESWVKIEDKKGKNKEEDASFPGNPEELNQSLNQKLSENTIIFPI